MTAEKESDNLLERTARRRRFTSRSLKAGTLLSIFFVSLAAHSALLAALYYVNAFDVKNRENEFTTVTLFLGESFTEDRAASLPITPKVERPPIPEEPEEFLVPEPTETIRVVDAPAPIELPDLVEPEVSRDQLFERIRPEEPVDPIDAVKPEQPAVLGPKPAVRKPSGLKMPTPDYPSLARRRGWEGTVQLRLLVDIDGTVAKVVLLKSSGYELLDDEAMGVAEQWVFKPAVDEDGKPVPASIEQPFTFKLSD